MPRHAMPVRAFGVLEGRWAPENLSGLTTATERDPRPGNATTESTLPRLDPSLVGAQSQTVIVEALQGGFPQLGGASLGVGYRLANEALVRTRGLQLPVAYTDIRSTAGLNDTSPSGERQDAAYDPLTGRVFVVVNDRLGVYNPHTDELTSVSDPTDIDYTALACAYFQDGSGRLVLAGLDYAAVSDDHGDTWVRVGSGTRSTFAQDPDWVPADVCNHYRLVPDGFGSLLWIGVEDIGGDDTRLRLAASDDVGASWTETGTLPAEVVVARATAGVQTAGTVWASGQKVFHVTVVVEDMDGGATLKVGFSDDDDSILAAGDVDPTAGSATYEFDVSVPATGTGRLQVTIGGSPTTGLVTVTARADEAATVSFDASPHPEGWIALVTITEVAEASVQFWRLPDAYTPLSSVEPVTVPVAAADREGVAVACDTNGVIWVFLGSGIPTATIETYYSVDRGLTWIQAADHANTYWSTAPLWMRACPHPAGGLAAAVVASGGLPVGFAQLGAWRAPGRANGHIWAVDSGDRHDLDYIGWAAPDSQYGMTPETVTGSDAGGNGWWAFTAAPGQEQYYSAEILANTPCDAGAADVICAVSDGASGTGRSGHFQVQVVDSGVTRRTVRVRVAADGFDVRDMVSGLSILSFQTFDCTQPTHFNLSIDGSSVHVMWRHTPDTLWQQATLTTSSDTFGSDGAEGAFGVIVAPSSSIVFKVWRAAFRAVAAAPKSGADNLGIGATTYPCPDAHDADRERAAYLQIQGGPSIPGEVHTIPPSYGYPLHATFPATEPSPSRVWRTASNLEDGSDQDCFVDLGADSDPGRSPSVALVVRNCNVRYVQLVALEHDGASVTVLATMDLATGFVDRGYGCVGNRLTPTSATTPDRYLRKDELAGCTAVLGSGVYRISGNSPGWFSSNASVKACIYLEGVDPEDPPNSTGFVTIVHHSGVLTYARAAGDIYRHWGWRIPVTDNEPPTAEGYAQIGCAYLFGLAHIKQWANGQEWRYKGNIRSVTDDAGTERRQQLGPTQRELVITHDDGARNAHAIRRTNGVSADYLGPEGVPLVGRDDVAGQLVGVLEGSKGGELPVLVILKATGGATDGVASETITDPSLWLVGYASEVRDTHALVDDGRTGSEAEFSRNQIGTIVEAV